MMYEEIIKISSIFNKIVDIGGINK